MTVSKIIPNIPISTVVAFYNVGGDAHIHKNAGRESGMITDTRLLIILLTTEFWDGPFTKTRLLTPIHCFRSIPQGRRASFSTKMPRIHASQSSGEKSCAGSQGIHLPASFGFLALLVRARQRSANPSPKCARRSDALLLHFSSFASALQGRTIDISSQQIAYQIACLIPGTRSLIDTDRLAHHQASHPNN